MKKVLRDRRVWVAGIVVVLAALYPFAVGALGGNLVASKLSAKLGLPVEVEQTRAGWGVLRLQGIKVGQDKEPLLTVNRLEIPFSALWGRGDIVAESPAARVERGGPLDNVSAVLARVRGGSGGASVSKTGGSSVPTLVVRNGSLNLIDNTKKLCLKIGAADGRWEPGKHYQMEIHKIAGRLGSIGSERDPGFGAESLTLQGDLEGLRPEGWPTVAVREGFVTPLATLPLTGISGALRPVAADKGPIGAFDVFFSGSYGGAKRALWTATGQLRPGRNPRDIEGTVALRAERFSLDKVAEILPASVLEPESTEVDAVIEATLKGRQASFTGKMEVSGLSLLHEKLASEQVRDLSFAVQLDGEVDLDRRRVQLNAADGRLGNLTGKLTGSLELAPGVFRFKNGQELHSLPKLEVRLQVPRIACSKLLASLPAPIVPRLQGFAMQGYFDADLHAKVDLADLDALDLGGKVGIDGCQVVKVPPEVLALSQSESLVQMVEIPPQPPGTGTVENMAFIVGPDNPDFVPYAKLSPHLVNAIMTTEDSGFFKHRGWVTPTFKTALRRNIENGGFRLGASSITMQMTKNILLSQEKTLSRKLQELFLVWYIEKVLPKERILELYFNAIEFGPRLYGIGPAARHYFGKAASDITPLEASFFASILPSPKRRYIHYCHGTLNSAWEKYLRRILTRMRERERLTDEEFAAAMASSLSFDTAEMTMSEKQCLDWVRRITTKTEAEGEPDPDAQ